MIFSSLTFLVFFAVVFAAYWAIPNRRVQNVLLLVASYVFYGWWDWRFALLMLAASLADFGFGQAIYAAAGVSLWLAVRYTGRLLRWARFPSTASD